MYTEFIDFLVYDFFFDEDWKVMAHVKWCCTILSDSVCDAFTGAASAPRGFKNGQHRGTFEYCVD